MKRRWRIVLMRKTGEVLGTVEAADSQAAERSLQSNSSSMNSSGGGFWCRSSPERRAVQ
jgi:hypothetical protein